MDSVLMLLLVLAGSGSTILQKAEIRVINQTICNQLLTDQLTQRMMCVGVLTGGVDACQVGERSAALLIAGPALCSALFILAHWLAFPHSIIRCTSMWTLLGSHGQTRMHGSSKLCLLVLWSHKWITGSDSSAAALNY